MKMNMKMRSVIYKEIVITVVIVSFAMVHKVECNTDSSGGASSDNTTQSVDLAMPTDGWNTSGESKQIVEFFTKADTNKFLMSLRTFLMGVRNMAEALGGFVPNDQHTEKNAMISRYSGIFNTVRVVSNAIQYVARFMEDILIREMDDTNEARQSTIASTFLSMMVPVRGAFKAVRGVVAQMITVYNYYNPEIQYTQCVSQIVQREFPGLMPKTLSMLNATYYLATDYLSTMFKPFDLLSPTDPTENYPELDNNQLNNDVVLDSGQPVVNLDYRQQLFQLYKKQQQQDVADQPVQTRTIRQLHRINDGSFPFRGPGALDDVDLSFDNVDVSTQGSIFDFKNVVAEQLAAPEDEPQMNPNSNQPDFSKCTQLYAMDFMWRLFSGFIISEDWKIL